ncbi:conserved exported hypothetical protein [uncultured Paludibacter sp.]|nr:conserved exported hypothetical protein [uncultured Paludibacter sp.]
MKKLIFITVLMLSVIGMKAQTNDSTIVASQFQYCEIIGTSGFLTTKVKINVDYGQETSFWNQAAKQKVLDENGKEIKFNSMVDALNYMGTQGWEFVQAFAVTMGNTNVYHFLMKRKIE